MPDADLYADGYTGRARRVVDDDRGYLLGVTFVSPGAEKLIHSATIARGRPGPAISRLWHAADDHRRLEAARGFRRRHRSGRLRGG